MGRRRPMGEDAVVAPDMNRSPPVSGGDRLFRRLRPDRLLKRLRATYLLWPGVLPALSAPILKRGAALLPLAMTLVGAVAVAVVFSGVRTLVTGPDPTVGGVVVAPRVVGRTRSSRRWPTPVVRRLYQVAAGAHTGGGHAALPPSVSGHASRSIGSALTTAASATAAGQVSGVTMR